MHATASVIQKSAFVRSIKICLGVNSILRHTLQHSVAAKICFSTLPFGSAGYLGINNLSIICFPSNCPGPMLVTKYVGYGQYSPAQMAFDKGSDCIFVSKPLGFEYVMDVSFLLTGMLRVTLSRWVLGRI